jgi:hypothetical protein
MQLIELLENTVGRIDKELFSERTRLSTISTVTRPLSTKWLERWNTLGRPDYNYEEASKQANSMLQEDITNQEQLQRWLANLYDLFAELVIYRGPLKGLQLGAAGRPAGMVGEGNERIYRRNWFSWIEEHSEDIMQKAIQISTGDTQSAYAASYSSKVRDRGEKSRDSTPPQDVRFSSRNAISPETPATRDMFIVTINSATSDFVASRTWFDQAKLEISLNAWMLATTDLWALDGETVKGSISLTNDSGTSNANFPSSSPPAICEAILKYVKIG